jgi:hypothetical protein
VLRAVRVRGIDQKVRVRYEHLAALHGLVEGVAVGDVDQVPPALKEGELRQTAVRSLPAQNQAESGLNQLGHRAVPPGRLFAEKGHHRVVDVQRGLHITNYIMGMVIRA